MNDSPCVYKDVGSTGLESHPLRNNYRVPVLSGFRSRAQTRATRLKFERPPGGPSNALMNLPNNGPSGHFFLAKEYGENPSRRQARERDSGARTDLGPIQEPDIKGEFSCKRHQQLEFLTISYEPEGREFESPRTHHFHLGSQPPFFPCVVRQDFSRGPKRAGSWWSRREYDYRLDTARRFRGGRARVRVERTYIIKDRSKYQK